MKTPREVAEKISDSFFTAGTGWYVSRLIQEINGQQRDGGGWSKGPFTDRVEAILKRELARRPT